MSSVMGVVEETGFQAALGLMRRFGAARASDLGGAIAVSIGTRLPVSKVADANLAHAFPALDAAARRQIIRDVWENIGRTMGELPHLAKLERTSSGPGWEIAGEDILRDQSARGGPAIFFSAHIGNWEMLPRILAHAGIPMASFYRALSNVRVNEAVNRLRRDAAGLDLPMFPKGAQGASGALAHLAGGGYLGILADQKMNDGIPVEFFGRPAMTAPALAALALRFGCPVIPGRVRRTGSARLRLEVEPPLPLPQTGDRQADIATLMRAVNRTFERWITDEPGSWLWLHRRWPKEAAN
ncbi:MAG TPA: lauroyl acyltransferase [Acidisoma sp.]|uniref:lysophospholipid acyltransferase family protein n=1 Tax=Acidisoma sp. TaxID=1872115 RepID=UPI002BF8D6D9|nr:lauroyl acyltransferase [Acidisoma sp.]HTI02653.1 lauroyl acyltransferase [Acidisoma sp.]